MKLGFVGTGVITEAVIDGLMEARFELTEIVISPRNAEIARQLATRYDTVRVAEHNQQVVDDAEIVFLAVRPQVAREVIGALTFRPNQHVVSFIATVSVDTLAKWIGIPLTITRAIPLPFVAALKGVTAIFPPDERIAALFSALGSVVEATDSRQYDLLTAASAVMGTYYGVLETLANWLEQNGLPCEEGSDYLRQLHIGLADAMQTSWTTPFKTMRQEFSTPGGLNEQIFREFESQGGTRALTAALDSALARIQRV